jgi:hypothetical protein
MRKRRQTMRNGVRTVAVLVALGLALRAEAQQSPASSFFTGANPRQINFKPIDVSQATKAFNMSNMVPRPTPATAFSFSNIFPRMSMPSWPPKVGVNQLPQGTNPYQPNRPIGVNLFNPTK